MQIKRNRLDDTSLFFNILKKSNSTWISPEDFLPVLEGMYTFENYMILSKYFFVLPDIVLSHPGLKFLGDNPMFQERYSKVVA